MALVEDLKSKAGELKSKAANYNPEKKEGKVARAIEEQTAKLPSDTFLWTAVGCMTASLTLKLLKQDNMALFVGQWVPAFLLFGIYNKIVKTQGHDKQDKENLTFG
ncbi:MAG: hypothetical protein WA874_11420 [Chryseosolibacter sp.]